MRFINQPLSIRNVPPISKLEVGVEHQTQKLKIFKPESILNVSTSLFNKISMSDRQRPVLFVSF